ncbi:MAG: hypothetical protein FWD18_09730 [Micrococcales bacterium]|nr:hypothetical protein [Micrococcales bacterium]
MSTPATPSAGRAVISRVIVPLAAMVIAFGAGWTISAGQQKVDWTDATVSVQGTSVSVQTGQRTVRAAETVPAWVDTDGTWRDQTWPACLPDGFSGTLPVAVTSATVANKTVTVLVAVDCRAS